MADVYVRSIVRTDGAILLPAIPKQSERRLFKTNGREEEDI
jgi:hypothetical protein